MSHLGSKEIMSQVKHKLFEVINRIQPWGVVLPATIPEVIKEGRNELSKGLKILAPGVGAQGALPGDALCAGANYEIVGRLITRSSKPREAAESVLKAHIWGLRDVMAL